MSQRSNNQNSSNWANLAWAAGGVAVGSLLMKGKVEEGKKSRAEKDAPEDVKEVCDEIGGLLEEWEPDQDCEAEDDFTRDLAAYLEENTDWEIEVCPNTPEGQPDILVGDLLAIELKINPNKGERDRLIGQCAGYSRLWVTWAVIVGASESRIGRLVDLLEDKGLGQIAVWSF